MAIYSCNLRSIGKTTHAAGTAGAHLRYIGRDSADAVTLAQHMPTDPQQARTWMDQQERADRKNARMVDKLRLALPRELDEQQRADLVQAFAADLTGDRVPWFAGIHQTGKDAFNPHAHVVIRDRDIETGKRVLFLSDFARAREKKGLPGPAAVDWVRERWEHHANLALERAGRSERIDRRSLEEQGIDRDPTIHIGPNAQHIDKAVKRPQSKQRTDHRGRVIDYPQIDGGRTRREFNAQIIDMNLERAARSGDPVAQEWARFEREQRATDRQLENRLIARSRRRTEQERNLKRLYEQEFQALRAQRDEAQRQARQAFHQAKVVPARAGLKARHTQERATLKEQQGRWSARLLHHLDITGATRRRRQEAIDALKTRQKAERDELTAEHQQARQKALAPVTAQYRGKLDDLNARRRPALQKLRDRHRDEIRLDERDRQQREAERQQQRALTEQAITVWQRQQRDQQPAPKREFSAFRDMAQGREQSRDGGRERSRGRTRGGPREPGF